MSLNIMDAAGIFLLLQGCAFLYLTVKEGRDPDIEDFIDRSRPLRCPICTYIYAFREDEEFSSCPRCGTINKNQNDTL